VKYSVITFGCRVNQSDSLGFEEQLLAGGAEATSAEAADLVLVNTCSVTASADQGARQTIRRIARVNPRARIIVTGCYATREPNAVGSLPNVERVVSNDDKPRLLTLLKTCESAPDTSESTAPTSAERLGDGDGACGAALEPGLAGRTAFTLRVQTGCAEPCSYCIIPETRGAPRSLPLDLVLREVRRVVVSGFKEVVLTGVHLGSWGRDLTPRSSLLALLEALHDLADDEYQTHGRRVLFRISSLEPMDCVPGIVDLVATSGHFAPHFHLPLQHASASMLRAMRRPYDAAYYAALVQRIRSAIPDASIGSDIIVGFPGERDADAAELAAYLESSPLTHLHVFPYSDRPGTPASRMTDRPAGAAVKRRGLEIRRIGSALTRRFLESQVGTTHRALTIEDGTLAVTGNYLKVRIPAGRSRNAWVRVCLHATIPVALGEVVG
jgi:threonylcarbamoyladenosine tRNA methylthiotransferase MtaB